MSNQFKVGDRVRLEGVVQIIEKNDDAYYVNFPDGAGIRWFPASALTLLSDTPPGSATPKITDVDLMRTTDHQVWAKEFVARFGGDEELMASWFASAMMAKHDAMVGPPNGDAAQYMLDNPLPGSEVDIYFNEIPTQGSNRATIQRAAPAVPEPSADAWYVDHIMVYVWNLFCDVKGEDGPYEDWALSTDGKELRGKLERFAAVRQSAAGEGTKELMGYVIFHNVTGVPKSGVNSALYATEAEARQVIEGLRTFSIGAVYAAARAALPPAGEQKEK